MKSRIYFLPGWGFHGDVLMPLSLSQQDCFLDYYHLNTESLDELALQLAAKISRKSVLVAWSLGGLLAIKIAALFPDKIKKIVLLASQPRFLEDGAWLGIDKKMAAQVIQQSQENFDVLLKYFLKWVNYPNIISAHKNCLLKHTITGHREVLINLLFMVFNADLRSDYQRIQADILHVAGEYDAVIAQNHVGFKALNHHVQHVVVKQAGHAGFLTHSEMYLEILGAFLRDE